MKIRLSLLLLVVFALVSLDASAQRRNRSGRQYNEIFPEPPKFAASYWYFAPGVTYMFPELNAANKTLLNDGVNRYEANIEPKGSYWFYLELGRYKMLRKGAFFKYFDYGLSYKGLAGNETFTGELTNDLDNVMSTNSGTSRFKDHFVTGHFNLNHVWEITDYHFIQNSLGVNADYAFNRNYSSGQTVEGVTQSQPGRILGQAHYKLGFGFKPSSKMIVIIGVETPVVTGWPVEKDPLHMSYFSSKYRPLIFSVRLLPMLRWREKNCAPVKTRDGLIMPTDMLHKK